MELKVEDLASHLNKIRTTQGEADYQQALTGLVTQLLVGEGTESFIEQLLKKLEAVVDLEALKLEAGKIRTQRKEATEAAKKVSGGKDFHEVMVETLRSQMPNLKTQAHFDLVMAAFESLQHYLNAAIGGEPEAVKLKTHLDKVLDIASKIAVVEAKAQDLPEEGKKTHAPFFEPPKEFTEKDKVEALLGELQGLDSTERLTQWYQAKKPTMDSIVTTKLRNTLFDAIRARRNALSN